MWFAGNAVIDDLTNKFTVGFNIEGYVLSSVQLGFIIGTLSFALLTLADRFSPSKVFFTCALLGALSNLPLLLPEISIFNLLTARFATGFFLAGIYPVGMKIASDYYKEGLGTALGFLVGALVLGTALPHLLFEFNSDNAFNTVLLSTSFLSTLGGFLIFIFVPDGPYRSPALRIQLGVITQLFSITSFRKAAIGYFGHMWELYAFWGFVPLILKTYSQLQGISIPIALWSFIIIAIGSISCVVGGFISLKIGSKKVARFMLMCSALFCLASPLFFTVSPYLFLIILCLWGMFVIADSPQFSTMIADAAPPELKGTGLTIVNCIGFAITIISIQLLNALTDTIPITFLFVLLSIGPLIGLYFLRK
ncbi:putative MFS family arabinose efflux permease [Aquimarina intermedia]|uniref:Putative MFS family arabinose efflux permease n=1 Tax=Aquimarina intermedia TaxID=350814 RepID=A0A5S5BXD1_9FLAO|nr:putative MFS family arabinose efflux permease [Aquimarina intermedia]